MCCTVMSMYGCMDYGPIPEEEFSFTTPEGTVPEGVIIVCEGNFMYGNSSMSFYIPSTGELQNEIFARANGMKMGDVAQSMTMHDGIGYVIINNSGVIFGIDPDTFRIKKVIKGINSPRYIHFNGNKAYVTSLYDPRIAILDVEQGKIMGYIETPGHSSTEQMVAFGDRLFVSCWSYDDTVLVIDTTTDTIEKEIKLRPQPFGMTADANGKLWVLTDGGAGSETPVVPALYRINPESLEIEKTFTFRLGDNPSGLSTNISGEYIYVLNGNLWRISADAEEFPDKPLATSNNTIFYSIGVDPRTGDIYVGDAIDYQQQGVVYRFSENGDLLASLRVGITPSAFCFK